MVISVVASLHYSRSCWEMPAVSLNTSNLSRRYVHWFAFYSSSFSSFVSCMLCWPEDRLAQETNQQAGASRSYQHICIQVKPWETSRGSTSPWLRNNIITEYLTNPSSHQMFDHRMAFKPLLYLTLWASAATCASAATSSLSNDITSFVPACAVDCFQSFISTNYDGAGCGSSPTLQCLCQKTGSSGFTIGEGGVQCLVAEINRKSCLGTDASREWTHQ